MPFYFFDVCTVVHGTQFNLFPLSLKKAFRLGAEGFGGVSIFKLICLSFLLPLFLREQLLTLLFLPALFLWPCFPFLL